MKWALGVLLSAGLAHGYPLDGFEHTGIRRLKGYALSNQNKIRQTVKLPPGALASMADVKLHLQGVNEGYDITPATPPSEQSSRRWSMSVIPSAVERIVFTVNPASAADAGFVP